jgi:hypothetical protein
MAMPINQFHAVPSAEALSPLTRLSRQTGPPQVNRDNGDNLSASAILADAIFHPSAAAVEITGAARSRDITLAIGTGTGLKTVAEPLLSRRIAPATSHQKSRRDPPSRRRRLADALQDAAAVASKSVKDDPERRG